MKVSRIVRAGSFVGVGPAGLPPDGLRTYETVDAPPTATLLVRPAGTIVHDRSGGAFWLNCDGTSTGWVWSYQLSQLMAVWVQLLSLAANATAINAIGNDALDAYALGTISFPPKSAIFDHDNFSVPKGDGSYVTFEYRLNGPGWVPVAGRITIDLVLSVGTPHDVAEETRAAVAANTSLVYVESGVGVGVEWVRWRHPAPGLLGNQLITEAVGSTAFTVTGFQYGVDGIVDREARRRVAYLGQPTTTVDVYFPLPLRAASGFRVTFRGTCGAADQALSLRIMGVTSGITRSGYYAPVGSAPSAFADGSNALVTVGAGKGYDVEVTVENPMAVERPGGRVVLFVQMKATGGASGGAPIAFWGWYSINLGAGVDLQSVGLASSVANGIPGTASYQLEVV